MVIVLITAEKEQSAMIANDDTMIAAYRQKASRIATIMKLQGFSGKVQFCIYAGEPLNVECELRAAEPRGIPSARLPVTQGLSVFYSAYSVILLPQVFERFTFFARARWTSSGSKSL